MEIIYNISCGGLGEMRCEGYTRTRYLDVVGGIGLRVYQFVNVDNIAKWLEVEPLLYMYEYIWLTWYW